MSAHCCPHQHSWFVPVTVLLRALVSCLLCSLLSSCAAKACLQLSTAACRMTATQIAPPDAQTWVNHQVLLDGREVEARSHNVLTLGNPDIAFQVCLPSSQCQL